MSKRWETKESLEATVNTTDLDKLHHGAHAQLYAAGRESKRIRTGLEENRLDGGRADRAAGSPVKAGGTGIQLQQGVFESTNLCLVHSTKNVLGPGIGGD